MAIEMLLEVPYRLLDRYELIWRLPSESPFSPRSVCTVRSHEDTGRCDALVYGSIVLGLRLRNLYPRRNADDIKASAVTLGGILGRIAIQYLDATDHIECGTKNYDKSIRAVLEKRWEPVLESHRVHMRAQKAKLGF